MSKVLAIVLLGLGASTFAFGVGTPEIDPGSGATALAMLAGSMLLFRGRIGKR